MSKPFEGLRTTTNAWRLSLRAFALYGQRAARPLKSKPVARYRGMSKCCPEISPGKNSGQGIFTPARLRQPVGPGLYSMSPSRTLDAQQPSEQWNSQGLGLQPQVRKH